MIAIFIISMLVSMFITLPPKEEQEILGNITVISVANETQSY